MIITETHSSSTFKYKYICNANGAVAVKNPNIISSAVRRIKEIFLPQGYPESVSSDYLEYQIWDTIQALVSTITSTVANQAILKGIGVGDERATILAATITWIMKDGAGLIGRILFAYWKGTSLDCNCKRWRLFADMLNDVSIFLDLFTSIMPRSTFLLIVCISSVGRSIVGVAGGATRTALTMHQARKNNVADVSAKDGSQESLSNLLGLIVNLMVVSLLTSSVSVLWTVVALLTGLHLYSNYRAIRALCMTSFNQARFHLVARRWLETGSVMSVIQGNRSEPVWTGLRRPLITHLTIGSSIAKLSSGMQRQLGRACAIFNEERYVLVLERRPSSARVAVSILLKSGTVARDQMKALLQAEIIEHQIRTGETELYRDQRLHPIIIGKSGRDIHIDPDIDLIERSLAICNDVIGQFSKACIQAGWVLDPVLFGAGEWYIDNV